MVPEDADGGQVSGQRFERGLIDLSALLLEAGMPVMDVRDGLEGVIAGLDPQPTVAVLPEAIFVGGPGGTRIVTTNAGTLSLRQSAAASRLLRSVADGDVALVDVHEPASAIRRAVPGHPLLRAVVGAALVALGLAVLFKCPWWAILLACVMGAAVGVNTNLLGRSRAATALVPFIASFLSTLAVGAFASWLQLGPVPLFAVCAPIAILIPGAIITNGLLELTSSDIVSGTSRLVYGLIVLGLMVAGILAGATTSRLVLDPDSAALISQIPPVTGAEGWRALPPTWLTWCGVVVLALGLGVAFGASRRLAVLMVAVMMATYAFLSIASPVLGSVVATGAAATALLFASKVFEASQLAIPAATFFLPAFLLLVPGTLGLIALTTFDQDSLSVVPKTFVSLCIGIKLGQVCFEAGRYVFGLGRAGSTRSARHKPTPSVTEQR